MPFTACLHTFCSRACSQEIRPQCKLLSFHKHEMLWLFEHERIISALANVRPMFYVEHETHCARKSPQMHLH